MVYMTLYK